MSEKGDDGSSIGFRASWFYEQSHFPLFFYLWDFWVMPDCKKRRVNRDRLVAR